ncbi:MAG: class I SAM-dependent methyltransferase [Chloroflexota bacterium]
MGSILDFRRMAEISSAYSQVLSPVGLEQWRTVGRVIGLSARSRVVDLACGYAESLRVWAKEFGARGLGVDHHGFLVGRARQRVADEGLAGQIEIVEGDAAAWRCEPGAYDVAASIGAYFVWGGYEGTVRYLRGLVGPTGWVVVGAAYYHTHDVPQALRDYEGDLPTEPELLEQALAAGCDLAYIARSTPNDWDRYVGCGWSDILRWLDEHPDDPQRAEVIERLHRGQRVYLGLRRPHEGFALHVLRPRA